MSQVGDRVVFLGNGSNGTTAGTQYSGVVARLDSPGGWGPTDLTVSVGGAPLAIIAVRRDTLLPTMRGVAPLNGTWRLLV